MSKINIEALKLAASRMRNGIECQIPALEPKTKQSIDVVSQQCGGQNCHLDVVFVDGVVWIARIRLMDPLLPPQATQNYIFKSEVATLKFLEGTSVPSPRVHFFEPESPLNSVGTSYVLMDKMPGKPINWRAATTSQKQKVMEQLADIFLELERYPFQLTGSVVPNVATDSGVRIGAFADKPWFATPEESLGPFSRLADAYRAIIQLHQQAIRDREISGLPVDSYLSLQWRESHLSKLASGSASEAGPFYLKHGDDKGDHILIDEDYTITSIIDWEFASTEAKELAFSSPCMMWPVGKFYDGSNELAADEIRFAKTFEKRGRKDIHDIVMNGRRWQRFSFFIGGGDATDSEEFAALFRGLRAAFAEQGCEKDPYEDWRSERLEANKWLKKFLG